MLFSTADTIVAVATPPGRGGIGVIRLAGPDAATIALRLTDRETPFEPRRATFVRIVSISGAVADVAATASGRVGGTGGAKPPGLVLDHAVITFFAAPHSYTGDDVVEISGHGSPLLLERIVALAMREGARLAEPGEFTLRAYLNGRIDLAQAEAVADLVNAVTPLQARAAMDQLEGTLTSVIAGLDATLFDLAARLEASLDFTEEGFHFVTPADAVVELDRLRDGLHALIAAGRAGRVLREGSTVVIAGAPNAGKSSLFNALVGSGRAIVTDVPGTTRDLLTERVDVLGLPVTLVDTAGLRDSEDAIESEGVARARQAQEIAALRVVVLDGDVADVEAHRRLLEHAAAPRVVVISKQDRPRAFDVAALGSAAAAAIAVSAVTGAGLDALRGAIAAALSGGEVLRDSPALTNVRHLALVETAAARVAAARDALAAGATEEIALVELNAARDALEAITGRRSADDLLHHIFSRFCIGK